jgi:RNA polymerase sigma-70 factor (sigma-E family)
MVAMAGMGEDAAVTGAALPVAELQADARADFDTLFDRYFDRAVRLAWLLAPGEPSAAEDAAADAIARVWPKWAKGRVEELWPYLRVAVVNDVRGRGRKRIVRERHDPARTAGAREFETAVVDRAVLTDALLALPVRQRTAVVLRYYEDLSEADAARAMGCSVGTVKSTTARGLAALRARMESTR